MNDVNDMKGGGVFHDRGQKVTLAWATHVGLVRGHNEDSCGFNIPESQELLSGRGALTMVADGMGGAVGGATASKLVVHTVIEQYYQHPSPDPAAALHDAISQANQVVHMQGAGGQGPRMGSTCTAVVIRDGMAYFGHVGDTRAYLIRDHAILQLTDDHSKVAQMVRDGYITADQAELHPERNVILRSVGPKPQVEVDTGKVDIRPKDRLLICSDGLSGLCGDVEMLEIVENNIPSEAVTKLVRLANERGGHDNITVQVIEYGAQRRAASTELEIPVVGAPRTQAPPTMAPITAPRRGSGALVGALLGGVVALGAVAIILVATSGKDGTRTEAAADASADSGKSVKSALPKPNLTVGARFLYDHYTNPDRPEVCVDLLEKMFKFINVDIYDDHLDGRRRGKKYAYGSALLETLQGAVRRYTLDHKIEPGKCAACLGKRVVEAIATKEAAFTAEDKRTVFEKCLDIKPGPGPPPKPKSKRTKRKKSKGPKIEEDQPTEPGPPSPPADPTLQQPKDTSLKSLFDRGALLFKKKKYREAKAWLKRFLARGGKGNNRQLAQSMLRIIKKKLKGEVTPPTVPKKSGQGGPTPPKKVKGPPQPATKPKGKPDPTPPPKKVPGRGIDDPV